METLRQTAWLHPERVGGIPAYSQRILDQAHSSRTIAILGAIAIVLILAIGYVYCNADAIDAGHLW